MLDVGSVGGGREGKVFQNKGGGEKNVGVQLGDLWALLGEGGGNRGRERGKSQGGKKPRFDDVPFFGEA
jgi:hypothetical protein